MCRPSKGDRAVYRHSNHLPLPRRGSKAVKFSVFACLVINTNKLVLVQRSAPAADQRCCPFSSPSHRDYARKLTNSVVQSSGICSDMAQRWTMFSSPLLQVKNESVLKVAGSQEIRQPALRIQLDHTVARCDSREPCPLHVSLKSGEASSRHTRMEKLSQWETVGLDLGDRPLLLEGCPFGVSHARRKL